MARILASPSRYIQGKGELVNLCLHAEKLSKKIFVLISKSGMGRVKSVISEGAEKTGCSVVYDIFNGECSSPEIDRVLASFKKSGSGVIAGIGGGKALDTAKAVGFYANVPVILVPTIASTDAPCSALAVIYTDSGVFDKYLFLPSNPNMVLVDSGIVSKAPVRLLIAGMGDALVFHPKQNSK